MSKIILYILAFTSFSIFAFTCAWYRRQLKSYKNSPDPMMKDLGKINVIQTVANAIYISVALSLIRRMDIYDFSKMKLIICIIVIGLCTLANVGAMAIYEEQLRFLRRTEKP